MGGLSRLGCAYPLYEFGKGASSESWDLDGDKKVRKPRRLQSQAQQSKGQHGHNAGEGGNPFPELASQKPGKAQVSLAFVVTTLVPQNEPQSHMQ